MSTFTVKIKDEDVVLKVRKPSRNDLNQAQKAYNEAFSEALQSKAPLRKLVSSILEKQGLWDSEKEKRLQEIQREINNGEFTLQKGGIPLKKAKEVALNLRVLRGELADLLASHNELDSNTAEGQATDARFNYLIYLCTVYNDNEKPFFTNYEDYLAKADDEVVVKSARLLSSLMYNLDENFADKLPENVFLKKYKFVDEKLRLIDEKGRLISSEGLLIDEDGNYVDEVGNRIDKFGHPLTKDGKFDVESQPFLDDDGQPITDSEG